MKAFHFFQSYEMASFIQASAKYPSTIIEVDWENDEVMACLIKFSKISLLHYYIFATVAVYYRQEYRKNNDCISEEQVSEIENGLAAHHIEFQPFTTYCQKAKLTQSDGDIGELFYLWFCNQEAPFVALWERMTEEIFHILFSDRQFLLSFNKSLADYLEQGEVSVPSSYKVASGHLKRCKRFPEWLKKAVFFRDRGRCVFCNKDLSGLLSLDFRKHLDHIVPLHLWGINDPCNIQLTCEACNLRKSSQPGMTSLKYVPYWDY